MGENIVRALDGVSAEFRKGDFWAIMGPSGSGKSTLLNVLGCLDRPTSGEYWIGDTEISQLDDDDLSEIRGARIGFVFQSFNLIQQLTVIENVEVPLLYQGWAPRASRERAEHLAAMIGLGDRIHHRPSELSGGQQQRVAIARALANDPLILLADEPTGNLDSRTAEEILELLIELNANGKTLIVVTHDEGIADLARSVMRLRDGQVESLVHNHAAEAAETP
jgi:putative ABC transport system ATP-binding protein